MAKISTGTCIAHVFQWGYDGKQPSIVSLGTTCRLSGSQLEDDGSSACVLHLALYRPVSIPEVDEGYVPGGR